MYQVSQVIQLYSYRFPKKYKRKSKYKQVTNWSQTGRNLVSIWSKNGLKLVENGPKTHEFSRKFLQIPKIGVV